MERFTIRVELHGAKSEKDYEKLHDFMKTEGFRRTITLAEVTYKLPPGEYNFVGEVDMKTVLAKVRKAAVQTHFEYGILITQSAGRAQFGMVPDDAANSSRSMAKFLKTTSVKP